MKYTKCTSTEFKKELSELCEKCPLPAIISQFIEKQILLEAIELK